MRPCEVTVVVEGEEVLSMNEQAHGGHADAIKFKSEILECAEMLITFCGGRKSQELVELLNRNFEVSRKKMTVRAIIDGKEKVFINGKWRNAFPTLKECKKVVRNSFSDKTLSESDRHIIGTLWAFIEDRLGMTPDDY